MGASSVAQRPDGQSDRCPESRSGTGSRATSWAEVVRLRTLPAAVAPVILGGGAALALETFSAPRTILAAGVALALQIGCNLRQRLLRRRCAAPTTSAPAPASDRLRGGAARVVKLPPSAASGSAAFSGLALLALSGQWWMLLLGAAAIAAAGSYTGGSRPTAMRGSASLRLRVLRAHGHHRHPLRPGREWCRDGRGSPPAGSGSSPARCSWSTTCAISAPTRSTASARWPCDWGSAARGRPSAPCSPSRSLWGDRPVVGAQCA